MFKVEYYIYKRGWGESSIEESIPPEFRRKECLL
jgi:hypothetical protein